LINYQEAQLNPALEKLPLVKKAWEIASQAQSVEDLQQGASLLDMSEYAASDKIVPGRYGSSCSHDNPIMLLGKSPAATEIEVGKPFQGPAGQILAKAVELSGQSIENFYHAHATYWRPKKENTPSSTQIAISRPFIQREIEIIKPKRIIVLGAKATDSLFGYHAKMSEDEEFQCTWRGIEVVIIRNHGYILRNPQLLDGYAEQLRRWGN
jgi:DNA polymerase